MIRVIYFNNTTERNGRNTVGKKSIRQVFDEEFFHPMEQEAFALGLLMGIMEARYKIFLLHHGQTNAIDRPGLIIAERILYAHEHLLRTNIKQERYSVNLLLNKLKMAMENNPAFVSFHKFIRMGERIYKHGWDSPDVLSKVRLNTREKAPIRSVVGGEAEPTADK